LYQTTEGAIKMKMNDKLYGDGVNNAEGEFRVAIKDICEIEHPTDIKEALTRFVRGLDMLDQALKGVSPTSDDYFLVHKLKAKAVEDMSNAITGLLGSAQVCFGKKQKVLFYKLK